MSKWWHKIAIPWQVCFIPKVTIGPPKLLENFHCGQLEAILPVMYGKDAFVRMVTGAGKLCAFFGTPYTER